MVEKEEEEAQQFVKGSIFHYQNRTTADSQINKQEMPRTAAVTTPMASRTGSIGASASRKGEAPLPSSDTLGEKKETTTSIRSTLGTVFIVFGFVGLVWHGVCILVGMDLLHTCSYSIMIGLLLVVSQPNFNPNLSRFLAGATNEEREVLFGGLDGGAGGAGGGTGGPGGDGNTSGNNRGAGLQRHVSFSRGAGASIARS